MLPRFPIYVPSRGRWQKDRALTVQALLRDGVPFRIVVEEDEVEQYAAIAGRERLLVLPFSRRGLAAARNWIRDHAEAEGHERHWQLDDNVIEWRRMWKGRRIPCHVGVALRVVEDLTCRYSNVGISGCNYQLFCPADTPVPFYRNVHVYSVSLINHAMPFRWRLAYNDDTDLCLQALTGGWTTLLVNAFMANKLATMVLGGGNTEGGGTDGVRYADGFAEHSEGKTDSHGRYKMARVLEQAWPGLVKVGRRFGRYQHTVNWGAFSAQELQLARDLDAFPEVDEYGLTLRALKTPESPQLRRLLDEYPGSADVPAPDGWRGLPAFDPVPVPPKVTFRFQSVEEQERLVKHLGVKIAKRTGPALSAWWPPRPREDLSSLRWELA